ncbi:MAG: ethanolamine utilization protein EutN [Planctomycetota bacterium]|nr:MAG: ethanolamine utilization protein EutN [Planctomycetota bacterium]
MQIALVVGHATATVKHDTLDGQTLLLVQPLMRDAAAPDGPPLLAVDRQGAGPGDRVIITSDGRAIRELFGVENSPIRWSVLGIVDEIEHPSGLPRA